MEPTRLERLTERERAYLRLVYNAMSSKEIALRYGVEPGTVDKALKSAMAKLGTSSRRAAARMLADAEQGQKLASQPQDLADAGKQGTIGPSAMDREWLAASMVRQAVREEQAPFWAARSFPEPLRLPFPRFEGDRNDLTIKSRLVWVGGIGLGLVIALAALVAISWGVSRMLGQIFRIGA